MLFNSPVFIFVFLPVMLVAFYGVLARFGVRAAFGILVLGSLFFYAWWNPPYVLLLGGLMLANFYCARAITTSGPGSRASRNWLVVGVTVNLLILAIFKYTDFLIGTANDIAGTAWPMLHIMMPLAISFFTFQKIAFLVDCHRGIAREDNLLNYMLFVSFFPQLIAGPIVHYQEIMPQFQRPGFKGADAKMMAAGLTLFIIGLFKKAVLADMAAIPANVVYDSAEQAKTLLTMADAWGGAVAYSAQIYFDFSGYSDMAIGLALMFGVRLPENFLSPYKATGMIEFWRRWHMTLSRFLRDYLYVPLGGNRVGKARQSLNVVITMVLGGLWHGASWNFVVWGLLHGIVIAINHGARAIGITLWKPVSIILTFIVVTTLWVFFRAESFDGAQHMLQAMFIPQDGWKPSLLNDAKDGALIAALLAVIWTLPSSMAVMFEGKSALAWKPSAAWGILSVGLALLALLFMQSHLGKQFIYFDF